MGNTTSYSQVPATSTETVVNNGTDVQNNGTDGQETQAVQNTTAETVQQTVDTVTPVVTAPTPVVSTVTPVVSAPVKKQPKWVHPFIEMVNRNCSEAEMINTLQAYCGRIEVGTDSNGNPIYETVDQTEFIAPILQVFSYCANNGKKSVVQWLLTNFVPLQVSYENNFCYFECLRWNHYEIADMLASHESFIPSMEVLENMLSSSKYAQFRKCMTSPYLRDDLFTYRFTFMHYIDNNQYSNVQSLLTKIKQRKAGQTVEITDKVYPNPRFAQVSQTAPIEPVTSTVEPPLEVPIEQSEPMVTEQTSQPETSSELQSDDVVVDPEESNVGLHQRTVHEMTEN